MGKMKFASLIAILAAIAAGVWVLVLQNAGVISTNVVYVTGGSVNVDSVNDEVKVNIRHINGWEAANHYEYTLDGEQYHSLGVHPYRD